MDSKKKREKKVGASIQFPPQFSLSFNRNWNMVRRQIAKPPTPSKRNGCEKAPMVSESCQWPSHMFCRIKFQSDRAITCPKASNRIPPLGSGIGVFACLGLKLIAPSIQVWYNIFNNLCVYINKIITNYWVNIEFFLKMLSLPRLKNIKINWFQNDKSVRLNDNFE